MVGKNVAEILQDHVTLELEGIDRMYLNGYVPSLQTGGGVVYFLKNQLECRVPSTFMVAPMSRRFVASIERFVEEQDVDLVTFTRGQRKDEIAQEYLAQFEGTEGVLFVGKGQEKSSVFRTEKRIDAAGIRYPWIVKTPRSSPIRLSCQAHRLSRRRIAVVPRIVPTSVARAATRRDSIAPHESRRTPRALVESQFACRVSPSDSDG